jgi:hypothetical protein
MAARAGHKNMDTGPRLGPGDTRTERERNGTQRHEKSLFYTGSHNSPLIREQGVGSSNLPAPTNIINDIADQQHIAWAKRGRKLRRPRVGSARGRSPRIRLRRLFDEPRWATCCVEAVMAHGCSR